MEKEKKKIISKFEIILMIFAVVVMGYLFMRSQGVHIAKQTETVEIIDNPRSKKRYKKKEQSSEKRKQEREVEDMLRQIDGRKEGRDYKPHPVRSSMNAKGEKSSDESRFIQLLRERYTGEDPSDPSTEFLRVLKASRSTYRAVRDLFADPNETPKSELETLVNDVSFLLQNKSVADDIYKKLKNQFNIPEEESAAFAKKGKSAVSDWASFVEGYK